MTKEPGPSLKSVRLDARFTSSCAAGLALLLSAAAANADFIRPDSATATSTFSSSYAITHAISGAGLPEGFTPADAHATYVGGNHWTTANGHTIGESATFSFNAPTPIGAFYMWNHRSNGVAANPHYAVTLFDLVFRDADGNVLSTLTDLVGVPNVAVAQTFVFDVVENVSSVQFIVRATANNNSSPYTGLAEVAFDTCIEAGASQPASVAICPGGDASFSVTPSGSGPLSLIWQAEIGKPGSGEWIDLADGSMPKPIGGKATVSGAATSTLTINGADAAAARRYRIFGANPCGEAASEPAALTICIADFNCNGVANSQDFFDFLAAFFDSEPTADFNADGQINSQDFFDFLTAFFGGCN